MKPIGIFFREALSRRLWRRLLRGRHVPSLGLGGGKRDLGTATSSATATNASLFGERVSFAGDRDIPAAMYQLEYVDGGGEDSPFRPT
ncbi:MAG: hypothetical protein DRJ42_22810 [Deltaproteobacteria bacterium]|nr:MAG: hypothetical protein DRJ42_22810 [Deltaproteobacteria bacterium]